MEARTHWVLNFDADLELEHGEGYQRALGISARFEALRAQAATLTRSAKPGVGYCFCPTPTALKELAQLSLQPVPCPSFDVLRQVNQRAFCAALPDRLPHAAYVTSRVELERLLKQTSSVKMWMLRRPFGFAGRGRKRFRGEMPDNVKLWLDATFAQGHGVELVPWVERECDFGQHGFLTSSGVVTPGELTVQECDAQGAWISTRIAHDGELVEGERERMAAMLTLVGKFLHSAGYFGPFGIDGFRYRDEAGVAHLHTCSDVNARYSMGWAIGMGDERPDLI